MNSFEVGISHMAVNSQACIFLLLVFKDFFRGMVLRMGEKSDPLEYEDFIQYKLPQVSPFKVRYP